MNNSLLITGGAGFIGRNLIAYLRECDAAGSPRNIIVFDNESMASRADVEAFDVNFINGDVRDVDALRRSLEGVDQILHLAADTRVIDSIADPRRSFDCNVLGTFNVLEAARSAGLEHVVIASTGGAIVGEARPPLNEEMLARPVSPYGASKLAAEGYCSAYAGAYGLCTTALRFSNIYGPGSMKKGSVVAHFFKTILSGAPITVYGDGTQARDFLFVKDLCAGISSALQSRAQGVYQLASGEPTSVNQLIEIMRNVIGDERSVEVIYADSRAGEVHRTWCNIALAQRDLDFSPGTALEDGLAMTWHWFKQHVDQA